MSGEGWTGKAMKLKEGEEIRMCLRSHKKESNQGSCTIAAKRREAHQVGGDLLNGGSVRGE